MAARRAFPSATRRWVPFSSSSASTRSNVGWSSSTSTRSVRGPAVGAWTASSPAAARLGVASWGEGPGATGAVVGGAAEVAGGAVAPAGAAGAGAAAGAGCGAAVGWGAACWPTSGGWAWSAGAPAGGSAPTSSSGGGFTWYVHSSSRSFSWMSSWMSYSAYSNSGDQNSASNGQTSTQMPQYMHRAESMANRSRTFTLRARPPDAGSWV